MYRENENTRGGEREEEEKKVNKILQLKYARSLIVLNARRCLKSF